MNSKILNILKYALGWPFSLLAFLFILKLIAPHTSSILSSLQNMNMTLLIYGIVCLLGYYFLRSLVWYLLIRPHSQKISFAESTYFWASSELKRYIPGTFWSFLGRAVIFEKEGIQKKVVAKTILIETIIFLAGCFLISILSLPFIIVNFLGNSSLFVNLSVLAILVIAGMIAILFRKFKSTFNDYKTSYLFLVLLSSSLGALLFGLGHYFIVSAFIFLHPQIIWQVSGFFVLCFLIGILSFITPVGLGVREGLIVWGLSKVIASGPAAFAALFSRICLIFAELVFLLVTFLINKINKPTIFIIEKFIEKYKYEIFLGVLSIIYILYFSTVSFLRFENFYAGRFDLGNMAQTVWNTSRGRIFQFTNPNGTDMISRLAFHADFILILLAPIYAIFPDPKTLLFIQTLVIAAGSVFVYLIAKSTLKNKNLALAIGTSYLLNPSIQRTNLYDFHPVTLATTLLLGMYYFYSKKKYVYFCIFAFLAAITKEQIWLIVALFGILLFFQHKKRILGGFLFLFSTGMFYYLVSVAIPNALGSAHFALSNYSDFGDSPASIIKAIIFSPQKTIGIILQPSQIHYFVQILSPVGYLVLFSPLILIFAVPDLLINLLSNNSQFHQIYYQYTAAISPFIFISTIYGIKNISKIAPKIKPNFFIVYVLFFSFYAAYLYGPLPGSQEANIDMLTKQVEDRQFIIGYLSRIPRRASVAASNNIGAHLSQRPRIYTLPLGIDKADVIVFFLNESESAQSIEAEREQLKKIRNDKNYQVTVEKGDFVVFIKIAK